MSSAEQLTHPREESAFAALLERHRGELQVHWLGGEPGSAD